MNNLKQIAYAFYMYAQDWDEMFPEHYNASNKYPWWFEKLCPTYVKDPKVWTCPSNPKGMWNIGIDMNGNGTYESNEYYPLSYADVFRYAGDKLSYVPRPLNKFNWPSETLLCSEPNVSGGGVDCLAPGGPAQYFDLGRHSDGVNVIFADTHVKWITKIPTDTNNPFWNPY